jgi:hypothetical protein
MEDLGAQIGKAAGVLWRALEGSTGWVGLTKLRIQTGLSSDMLQRAIGWLAREGKIQFQVTGKAVKIMLK